MEDREEEEYDDLDDVLEQVRLAYWTTLSIDVPNHLVLWGMALITSDVLEQPPEPEPATQQPAAGGLSHTDLDFHPSRVQIVTARVDGDVKDPAYIMKCFTPASEVWGIARRFSAIKELQKSLSERVFKPHRLEDKALRSLPFPHKVAALTGHVRALSLPSSPLAPLCSLLSLISPLRSRTRWPHSRATRALRPCRALGPSLLFRG